MTAISYLLICLDGDEDKLIVIIIPYIYLITREMILTWIESSSMSKCRVIIPSWQYTSHYYGNGDEHYYENYHCEASLEAQEIP